MDISTRLVKINTCGSIVFALYFYLQTCAEPLRTLSFLATVPLAKNILDRMSPPVRIETDGGYPARKLFINFLKYDYGVWSVLSIELIRRIAFGGVFNGVVSMTLMCGWLIGYVFSTATGVCYTNVKIFRKGTRGFTLGSWLLISISILMGSGWVGGNTF